jgi:hypothetical protein
MKNIFKILGTMASVTLLATISLLSCNSTKNSTYINKPQDQKVVMKQGGAQLWANNCNRCHNTPPPNAYSDNEWEAIVNHMQKVAGFTVSDSDKIAEFLKASN